MQTPQDANGTPDVLTPRQREISILLRTGLTNKEIAQRLHLTESTIKTHLFNFYRKMGVHSRTALIARLHADLMRQKSQ